MATQLPKNMTLQGKSGEHYKLYITNSGAYKMTYPMLKNGKPVRNTTLTKVITREYYEKAYQHQQDTN